MEGGAAAEHACPVSRMRGRWNRHIVCALALVVASSWLLNAAPTHAQLGHELPLDACVDHLNDEQVSEQLAFVEQSLSKQRLPAAVWWTTWTGFNLFNLAYGAYRTATSETRLAFDSWLVSAIGAGIFVATASVLPMPGLYAHRMLSRLPDDTPAQRRHKLKRGISLLDRAARVETTNSNLTAHMLGLAYATFSTAYVWIRNRHEQGEPLALALALQFTTSWGVAELTFWTAPRRGRRDLKQHREHTCDRVLRTAPAAGPEQSVKLHLGLGHLALTARF